MRSVLVVLLVTLAGCSVHGDEKGCDWKGHHHDLGEMFPDDDCNTCTCTDQGTTCTLVYCDKLPDANPAYCGAPTTYVIACDGYFCRMGEHCVNGACACGDHAGCQEGDTCASAGPGSPDGCGSICCGASGPCPQ